MSVVITVVQVLVSLTALSLGAVAVGLLRRRAAPRDAPGLGAGARGHAWQGGAWPDVDVILPAHDEERQLGGALDSLLAQEYPGRFTIWVVDDRSSDGTLEVATRAARRDARVRIVQVTRASSRWAPKVHAVWHGIRAGGAPWIATTDADCRHHPGWLRALLAHAAPDVVLVAGHVETARRGGARGLLGRVEALDWIALMITARSLADAGIKVAASANNQAYSRAAWRSAGGFGVAARAPSGDEDLLVQRIGREPGSRVVFADAPEARVLTAGMPSWHDFLDQRRRWVSRFHHLQQYRPGYIVAVLLLGLQSVALALGVLALPLYPDGAAPLLSAWAVLIAVEAAGLHVGLHRLERPDLMGWPVLAWALLHPFVIAVAVTWSLLRPGSWRAGARSYRRRLLALAWRLGWRRWRGPWRGTPARSSESAATGDRGDRW